MKKKGIGLKVKQPGKACTDKNCPFHRSTSIRGRKFTGTVVSDKMTKTVTVAWIRRMSVPKYERYEKKRSKIAAHNPDCINAKKGDVVRVAETRPLSKTKHFVVIEVLGQKSKRDALKDEAIEEAETTETKVAAAKALQKDTKATTKPKEAVNAGVKEVKKESPDTKPKPTPSEKIEVEEKK